MSVTVEIALVAIVGDGDCTSSEDGQKVYEAIVEVLRAGNKVQLSFKGVEDLTSAFLNAAVGQLYKEYSEEDLKAKLSPTDFTQDDLSILKRVVERAKDFFNDGNEARHRNATDEALGGSDAD